MEVHDGSSKGVYKSTSKASRRVRDAACWASDVHKCHADLQGSNKSVSELSSTLTRAPCIVGNDACKRHADYADYQGTDKSVSELGSTLTRVPCIDGNEAWAQILLSAFLLPIDNLEDSEDDEPPMTECERRKCLMDPLMDCLASLIPEKASEKLSKIEVRRSLPNVRENEVKEPEGRPPQYQRSAQQRRSASLSRARYLSS